MSKITTDLKVLRKISQPVRNKEISDIAEKLIRNIPENALGLSAPQISIHKRIFLANLSTGKWIFVNPKIIYQSKKTVVSTERCLSLPNIQRNIPRHTEIRIQCDSFIDVNNYVNNSIDITENTVELFDQDAFIIQHEYDHLNGILIIDRPNIFKQSRKYEDAQKDRKKRILAKRNARKDSKFARNVRTKLSEHHKKRDQKAKKKERSRHQKNKISVEIQERYQAERIGLFK